MSDWPRVALQRIGAGEPLALVTLLAVEGSAPREAGTRMLIWDAGQWGTIGGGNLEHQAAAQARRMLGRAPASAFAVQDYPLGPLLGQCCGGRVRLLIERLDGADQDWLTRARAPCPATRALDIRIRLTSESVERVVAPAPAGPVAGPLVNGQPAKARGAKPGAGDEVRVPMTPAAPRLRLFGAGHVGAAVARALEPLPFRLEWYDSRPEVAAQTGARLATPEALRWIAAEPAPFTLVLTHDHALDFALVLATLGVEAEAAPGLPPGGYLGLIGSRTKRARFVRRLREAGVGETALSRLVCPIGLSGLAGKAPEVIAASVVADLLIRLERALASL